MPTLRIPNPGIQETVVRPTTVAITDQVLEFLKLNNTVSDIRYITHSGDVRMPTSAVGERSGDYASFSGTNRAWVEVEEDIFTDGWSIGRPDVIDTTPLFFDRSLQVALYPFMESSQTTLKIRFTSHNRDTMRQTRDSLASRIATLQDGIQHTVDFSIGIHDIVLRLLQDVWIKRETNAGYGDDFLPYLLNHSSASLTTASDASGQKLDMVFKRRMTRINGYFQVSSIPEKPSYQEDGSVWEFSVEYKVNYDIPTQMHVRYPIMVHNQYLDPVFLRHLERNKDIRDKQNNLSLSQAAAGLVEFGRAEGSNLVQDRYFNIPSIDHFEPSITPLNTATVFIALLKITEDNTIPLLNLDQLGTICLDSDILKFLREVESPFITQIFKSFFYIHLYEDHRLMEPDTLRCDEKLNVYSTIPLKPRKTYRIRLSMIADITVLSIEAFQRLWDYPEALMKIINSINEAVRNGTDFFDMAKKRKWEPWMVSPIWQILCGVRVPPQMTIYRDPATGAYPQNTGPGKSTGGGRPGGGRPGGGRYPGDNSPGGTTSSDDFWGGGYKPPIRPNHNLPPEFQVPSDILAKGRLNNLGMRTVQIQGIVVYNKERE